jgi:hypothetical protein
MERRHPLQTHAWADPCNPHQIMQDGELLYHHRCVRCGRDFLQTTDGTGWQAAFVGVQRIEPLADGVTERWVTDDCPGRLMVDDCESSTQHKYRDAKFSGEARLGAFRPSTIPRCRAAP